MEGDGRLSILGISAMPPMDESVFHNFLSERSSCMYTSSPNSSPETYQPKMYKLFCEKENSRDIMCKRRLDFNHNDDAYLGLQKPTTVGVARRNERERNRVKLINMTFATLREHIPNGCKIGKSKKMSKVDTLKAAIDYIRYLQDLVDEHDAVNAVLDGNCVPKQHGALISPSINSPSPSSCSETSPDLSNEEEELLDFASWF